ncbi:ribose-phosphate diphosphokinase [Marinimicrobium agarilyticum]|uniref:ribose-phosphate diphosphokinase n=1 Tax=Marinimicrobium agarilyticum TaxID=306546 RepID=UPI0004171539|nr:ribose-phosphate diphosphokinase [Marinimicrobium agarilyticum]
MRPILFSLTPELPLQVPLRTALGADAGAFQTRRFPDGETYLRVVSAVTNRHCVVLVNLVEPDAQFLPLAFLAATLKELGAASVGLVAPYLSYMRQDTRFQSGEAVTSRVFAGLLSEQVDWLITVDPHLHRYRRLDDIYSIPTSVVPGAPALARWFARQEGPLLLVGPDSESEQWVSAIAREIGQPYVVGGKERRGDRDVVVSLPDLSQYKNRRAVIVDDVISSGHTILKTLDALFAAGMKQVDCVAVHGIFAEGVDERLTRDGVETLVTTNSVPHASNGIDLSPYLADAVRGRLPR